MSEEPTIKDEIKKLNESFDKLLSSGKVKGFKLPSQGRLNKTQIKKNFVTAIVIGDNREIKFIKAPIEEGTITVDGIPRIASTDFMLSYQGKPAMILPSWSVKPFSPVENYQEDTKEKMTSQGYKLLLNRIETGKVLDAKKSFGKWWLFPLIIAVIVVLYLVFGRK